jgi:ketosteroid isomerase-like protein
VYRWIVARVARSAIMAGVNGRPELATRMMADDVAFEFPGSSSFGASVRGKDAVLAWLRRFAALRPQYVIRDVVVAGPPWNTRLAIRLSDRIGDDYANEGVQYLRMRWGKVISDEVFVDTEKVADLERRHPEIAGQGVNSRAASGVTGS